MLPYCHSMIIDCRVAAIIEGETVTFARTNLIAQLLCVMIDSFCYKEHQNALTDDL